jgi:steroid delta-isomerase-like uncharacterized protein
MEEGMSKQANMEAQQKMGEAINQGKLDVLREVFAPNVQDHDPAPDQGAGPDGFISFFTNLREAFPDLKIAPEETVADEEKVAIAYTMTGTHKGNFLGIPATGKKIKARGVQIARFKDGKIVERWGSSDELGILKQVGGVKGVQSTIQTPAITGKTA